MTQIYLNHHCFDFCYMEETGGLVELKTAIKKENKAGGKRRVNEMETDTD